MNEDNVGYGRPPKRTQFKPGTSGNPKGRPRKPRRALLPSQTRKDFLREIDKIVEVRTANGAEKMTKDELVTLAIVNGAVKGQPTCLKMYEKRLKEALEDRLRTYAPVRLAELLRSLADDPVRSVTNEERDLLHGMFRYIERMY